MKPPPRTRIKPDRSLKSESAPQVSGKLVSKWQKTEQRKLLSAMKRLYRTGGRNGENDYAFLRKCVPTRSVIEIQSVVESLKNKTISCASFELKKKRLEERKLRKPIEAWTHMASALAGTLEKHISTAFSQMLIVSSTEPRTLRNCDPPQVYRPSTDRPVGRTVPLRPMPRLPLQGKRPGTSRVQPLQFKTPAITLDPIVRVQHRRIPPTQQQLSTTVGISHAVPSTFQSAVTSCQSATEKVLVAVLSSPQPASRAASTVVGHIKSTSVAEEEIKSQTVGSYVIHTNQQDSDQKPTTVLTPATSELISSNPHTPLSSPATSVTSATRITSDPSITPSSVASTSSHCTTSLSTSAAAFHARFGRTSKYATKDSPRVFGVKCVVDFERIYRCLSVIHEPNYDCHLTPMESAIMLDLLMSLPEELRLLDCDKLHKHLIQVYQCLSSPADSKNTKEMFENLKEGLGGQTEAPSSRDCNRTNGEQNAAGTADGSDVTDSGAQKLQPDEAENQSLVNKNTAIESSNTPVMELCPPLNPFMVPLKMLMHK